MLIATIPALVSLVGALAFALSANAKVSELGRIAFACGLVVLMYVLSGHVIRI